MGARMTMRRQWRGKELTASVRAEAPLAATAAAEYMVPFMIEQTPVESGNLRGEYAVIPATDDTPAEIVNDSVYGRRHHEEPMNHTPGAGGEPAGKDHFMSDPMKEQSKAVFQLLATRMKGALKG